MSTHKNRQLFEYFICQVRKNPKKIAIIDSSVELSYEELAHEVDLLANELPYNDSDITKFVAVSTSSRYQFVIAILAILKNGYGYLPLDPNWPLERFKAVISDSRIDLVLTSRDDAEKLLSCNVNVCLIDTVLFKKNINYKIS